jgi:hypothetical protein
MSKDSGISDTPIKLNATYLSVFELHSQYIATRWPLIYIDAIA